MGGGESKLGKRPQQSRPIKSNLLYFKRCIFLTQEQYNNKQFKPDICYHKQVYIDSNSEIAIDNEVRNIIRNLSNGTGNGKVPMPIYVMYAKKLVPYGSFFNELCLNEGKEFNRLKKETQPIKDEAAKKFKVNIDNINADTSINIFDKQLRVLQETQRYIGELNSIDVAANNYLNGTSCLKNNKDMAFVAQQILADEEAYNKSLFRKFTKRGFDVHIFVPNLNKEGRYIANFNDYSFSNDWAKTLSTEHYYYTIVSLVKTDYRKIFSKYISDKKILDTIHNIFTSREKDRLPFIRESNNTCFWQGCVSDYGEDLSILPNGNSKDADLGKAAKNMAPWLPTKCLRRFNYSHHMVEDNDYKKINKILVDTAKVDGDCFKDYKKNFDKLAKGDTDIEDIEDNLLDQFKKCAYEKIFEEIGDKKEKYSQRHNKNIIKELAKRNLGQPGVQENSFPLFRVNENDGGIKNYLIQMPWGNKLIGKDFVINLDIPLKEGTYISSFNEKYKLMVFTNGIVGVIEEGTKIKYLLNNRLFHQKNKELVLEEGGYLSLYGYDGKDRIQLWTMFVSKVDNAIAPYSLILENNSYIKIYDNGFNNRSSTELINAIENYGKPGYPGPSDFDYDEYMYYLPKVIVSRSKDPFYEKEDTYARAEQEFKLLTEYYGDGENNQLTDSQIRELVDNPDIRDKLMEMSNRRDRDTQNYISSGALTDEHYASIDNTIAYELEKDIFVRLHANNLATERDNEIFASERTSKEKLKAFIEQH